MRLRALISLVTALLMIIPLLSSNIFAEEAPEFIPDKLLCAKMIRFGKEAYQRGKFQDAKKFFRQATKYDPDSKKAWRFYDQAVLFALAERVELKENKDLLLPGRSTSGRIQAVPQLQQTTSLSNTQAATEQMPMVQDLPVTSAPVEEAPEDEEEEEEGC